MSDRNVKRLSIIVPRGLVLTFCVILFVAASPLSAPLRTAQAVMIGTDEIIPVTANADWTPVEQDFDGIIMVLVPPGCFMMGSTEEQVEQAYKAYVSFSGQAENIREFFAREHPQTEICFDEPFWIGKYEVTNAEYAQFIEAGGYDNEAYWTELGWEKRQSKRWTQPQHWTRDDLNGANQPVVGISWYEAMAYASWRGCRLPTEAEWEYAARGPDGLMYPWGDEFISENLVYGGEPTSRQREQPAEEVGSCPGGVSWVGALDMSGNVFEWVHSELADYPYNFDDGREDPTSTAKRVTRGGSWRALVFFVRAPGRWAMDPDPQFRPSDVGLRLLCPFDPAQ